MEFADSLNRARFSEALVARVIPSGAVPSEALSNTRQVSQVVPRSPTGSRGPFVNDHGHLTKRINRSASLPRGRPRPPPSQTKALPADVAPGCLEAVQGSGYRDSPGAFSEGWRSFILPLSLPAIRGIVTFHTPTVGADRTMLSHVDLFVRCLWDVFRREATALRACATRFPIDTPLNIDEVTFAYLAIKEFLLVTEEPVVVRKEQWVGERDGMSGKRCDVVLGDASKARNWIEMKVWKPAKATGYNRTQIWRDIDKLRDQVAAGLRTCQTYNEGVKLTIPDDFTRHVLVMRAEQKAVDDESWRLRRAGEECAPVQVLHQESDGWHLYLATFEVAGTASR